MLCRISPSQHGIGTAQCWDRLQICAWIEEWNSSCYKFRLWWSWSLDPSHRCFQRHRAQSKDPTEIRKLEISHKIMVSYGRHSLNSNKTRFIWIGGRTHQTITDLDSLCVVASCCQTIYEANFALVFNTIVRLWVQLLHCLYHLDENTARFPNDSETDNKKPDN